MSKLLLICTLCALPLAAEWRQDDFRSVNSIKAWRMDDRIVYVKGRISRVDGHHAFYLADDSGEIRVNLANDELHDHHFHTGSFVEVKGRVIRDHAHADLNAHAIKLADGRIIGDY